MAFCLSIANATSYNFSEILFDVTYKTYLFDGSALKSLI